MILMLFYKKILHKRIWDWFYQLSLLPRDTTIASLFIGWLVSLVSFSNSPYCLSFYNTQITVSSILELLNSALVFIGDYFRRKISATW